MIRLVQGEGEKRRLLALCEKTPFGCKIASIANSYGFDKSFANFWLNTEEDVVYCLVDGAMLLSGTVLQGDASREFLHVVGAREVLCAVRNAEAMNLTPTQVGDVLKHTQEPGDLPKELPPSVNIREIYTLLEKAGMIGEFEPFYLDLSHKLRHNEALALTERGPGGLAGLRGSVLHLPAGGYFVRPGRAGGHAQAGLRLPAGAAGGVLFPGKDAVRLPGAAQE